jgi:hypothetical protein
MILKLLFNFFIKYSFSFWVGSVCLLRIFLEKGKKSSADTCMTSINQENMTCFLNGVQSKLKILEN